jgi:oxalate decarboxylase/phosphoglucose isomerase-like protein (cupin superfamily)
LFQPPTKTPKIQASLKKGDAVIISEGKVHTMTNLGKKMLNTLLLARSEKSAEKQFWQISNL